MPGALRQPSSRTPGPSAMERLADCRRSQSSRSAAAMGAPSESSAPADTSMPAFLEDGASSDPAGLRHFLRSDPAKLSLLREDAHVAQVVEGEDDEALQALLREIFQARRGGGEAPFSVRPESSPRSGPAHHMLHHHSSLAQAEKKRLERFRARMPERTIDAQRASATVPRDTVQLYKQLDKAGLQYGPAFRLLRNVHVPDTAST